MVRRNPNVFGFRRIDNRLVVNVYSAKTKTAQYETVCLLRYFMLGTKRLHIEGWDVVDTCGFCLAFHLGLLPLLQLLNIFSIEMERLEEIGPE